MEATNKRISLPDEEPEIFSSVLEYLYKGDYYPRLVHNKRRNAWELESSDGGAGNVESTVYHHGVDGELLKDTVIYCTAEKYGLDELKRVALRKQGLRMFISILFSVHNLSTLTSFDGSTLTQGQNPASNAIQSSPLLVTPTPTPPTPTPSSAHTTSPSSFAAEALSSVAAPCSWRCRLVAASCSLICLLRCATMLMMLLRLRKSLPPSLSALWTEERIENSADLFHSSSPRSVRTHH